MDEHDGRDERLSQRPPAEGVRIIRADEAKAALDAGQAAGRRPDDEPRFGDVPAAPAGPRPSHRFPIPGSAAPGAGDPVPRPPAPTGEMPTARPGFRSAARPLPGMDNLDPRLSDRPGEVPTQSNPAVATQANPTVATQSNPAVPAGDLAQHAGRGPDLPHWTDPPTGETPGMRSQASSPPSEGPRSDDDDDMVAWQALGARGPRWRGGAADFDEADDVGGLVGDRPLLGALDATRTEHSDMYSFDEQFELLEEERSGRHQAVGDVGAAGAPRSRARRGGGSVGRRAGRRDDGPGGGAGGRDLTSAAAVGVVLVIVLGFAYLLGSAVMMVLSTVVVLACAVELYNIVQRSGFRPATLLGLCATAAVMFAAYWRGEPALPLVLVLMFGTTMLWYMLEVVEARPMVNIAVTLLAFVWVGLLGSYAPLLLRVHDGRGLLLWAVLVTVVADIVAYGAGTYMGSHLLAPSISPGKTWEGAVVGGIAAILVGGIIAGRFAPWSTSSGLKLGLVIAVVAPIGDLFESMVKRDLHLKDSGSLLPGHGGLLDRFDSMLFALPATYYLVQYLRLH